MKHLLLLSLLTVSAAVAFEQTTVDYGHIAITADRQERDGAREQRDQVSRHDHGVELTERSDRRRCDAMNF